MKNTKLHRIALDILRRAGCEKTAYTTKDIKNFYDGNENTVADEITDFLNEERNADLKKRATGIAATEIVHELIAIGDAEEAKKPKMKWVATWDTPNFSDGIECRTLNEAKGHVLSCLEGWAIDTQRELCDKVQSGEMTREEAVDEWNYMICNYSAWVYRAGCDCDEVYWEPSKKELKEVFWQEVTEWVMPEDK